ncbi:MAG: sigma-70 family RNA polymerase sigma factor [Actinomycetota bacterium]|nr:sigma-70 family RNA polymerase sigma factor [Actinomycetota bacterium]
MEGWVVASEGEREFEALYAANLRPLLGYALRRTATPADAADVVAETMLTAWRRRADVPGGDETRLWLYGVARRVLANHTRGERRRHRLGARLAEVVEREVQQHAVETPHDGLAVAEALSLMNELDRELLRLTAWEQLSPSEIAVALVMPAGTVRSRLSRARAALREVLELPATDGLQRNDVSGHVDVGSAALLHPNKEELP